MRRLFWLFIALFTAIGVHAGFTLAVPAFTLQRSIDGLAAREGRNHFFILKRDDQVRLFPTYPSLSVVGLCAFDVGRGPVDLVGNMPPGFWTLAIYSSSGDVLYAANNEQAGTNAFLLRLQAAPGLFDMLKDQSNDDSPVGNAWTVKTADLRGLAVLWQPVADAAMRPQIADTIAASRCQSTRPQ
jgi:uncharacterized membrane protein